MRTQTKPGDIVIKTGTEELVSKFISMITGGTDYVHGGIAVGQGVVVEVNGGLPKDTRGKSRLLANIYVTDLTKDTRDTSYDVFRCVDSDIAEAVAIQAYPFAAQGTEKSWHYNLKTAFRSVKAYFMADMVGDIKFLSDKSTAMKYEVLLDIYGGGGSVLDVANMEKRKFFCTQFIVWMYHQTCAKLGYYPPDRIIPIAPADAHPAALVDALDKSGKFFYAGTIRGIHVKSAKF